MRREAIVTLGIVAALVLSAGGVATATTDRGGSVLVVDAAGDAEYSSVQAAVDAADPSDTVRVRPGVYPENVTVDGAVRIVAPQGATLDGTGIDGGSAIEVETDADVVVEGLTITDYSRGISALGTAGDWQIRNVTVRNVEFGAVAAGGSEGDWVVSNLTVRNASGGVAAGSSSGDWTVTDTRIRNVTIGHGVEAMTATGDWTLDGVTVSAVHFVGVSASFTEGDWRLRNVTVRNATVGVGAIEASGSWSVRRSAILDSSVSDRFTLRKPAVQEGVGIYARDTNGSWSVHGTRFAGNEAGGIVAEGADPAGNATHNWWGEGEPRCTGTVDCEPSLTAWPPEQPIPGETATPTPTATPEPGANTSSEAVTTTSAPGFGLPTAGLLGLVAVVAALLRRE